MLPRLVYNSSAQLILLSQPPQAYGTTDGPCGLFGWLSGQAQGNIPLSKEKLLFFGARNWEKKNYFFGRVVGINQEPGAC